MTEQYQQTNVNQQRPARFVDQSNADTTTPILGLPAVTLGTDVTFVLLGTSGPPSPYGVILPGVRVVEGFFFFLLNNSGDNVIVAAQSGETVGGGATISIGNDEAAIVVSNPANNNTTPPTLPTNWSVLKNSPA